MTVVARLEVIPTRDGSMSGAVASAVGALEEFDVSYETTPTDTVIEADDPTEVFAAAEAAHRAVPDDRVITALEVDDQRTRTQHRRERVKSVERRLGHPAIRERQQSDDRRSQRPVEHWSHRSAGEIDRYGGPWNARTSVPGTSATESRGSESRYLQSKRRISH
ncbi:thiamine-binding protein [Halorussus salinisoli]|uniref:thiamine-binding protein n=1 Tax=Halorussus salinisoli TaxID=2558242 RepID=UPI0010C1AFB7